MNFYVLNQSQTNRQNKTIFNNTQLTQHIVLLDAICYDLCERRKKNRFCIDAVSIEIPVKLEFYKSAD